MGTFSLISAHSGTGVFNLKEDGLIPKGLWHQRNLILKKKIAVIQAVAVPVAPSPSDSADYRKQLSESYGFRQIGEPLPEHVTLKDVIDSLPKKVFLFLYFFNLALCHVSFINNERGYIIIL